MLNIQTNRTKINFKNYKDACEKLKEQEYKRGSKEKAEQIKRWETEKHIFKQKDNSFTYINTGFINKKETKKKNNRDEKTLIVNNHSVFLGKGKYKFKEFDNMKDVFLNFIDTFKATTKKQYIEDFFSDCYLSRIMSDDETKKVITDSKSKSIAVEIFKDECRYVFNQFLKEIRYYIDSWITYYDSDNEEVNYVMCEAANRQAIDELNFRYFDYKTRVNELYAKINDILMDYGLNPVVKKETIYFIHDYMHDFVSETNEQQKIIEMTRLYEIIKCVVIAKLRAKERKAAIGEVRVKKYELTTQEYLEAEEFINTSVCYTNSHTGELYYSIEDISENRS